jgi:nitrite reductase (NADH) small subunit
MKSIRVSLPNWKRERYTPQNRRGDFTTEFAEVTESKEEETGMGFVFAAKTGDVPPGTIREFQVEGKAVALANVDGQFHAIDNTCLHRGGPLGDGPLEGAVVTCPWHGWQYDVRTGKVGQNPTVGVECYAVEVRGDEVFVNVGT